MAEPFLSLSRDDQHEALQAAAARSGRPPHLLEKDVWVVWSLDALFRSALGGNLVFKGGTSLSKAYAAIQRFSEDVDLTYDIRAIASDLVGNHSNALPPSRSQADRWTKVIRSRLSAWVRDEALVVVQEALVRDDLGAQATATDENILIEYPQLAEGTGYVAPTVKLEFGARATGEPWVEHAIVSDAAHHVDDLVFPTATARVMRIERTFWEKATAAHVYCLQGKIRGERFVRHWSDLARLFLRGFATAAIADRDVAASVAAHKALFFREKDASGAVIDYYAATSGGLCLVPSAESKRALRDDYAKMIDDGLFLDDVPDFDELMDLSEALESECNTAARSSSP
jgi:hypothetical protein